MSKEVTEIINTLCEKLGLAASVLIPEIAKKNVMQDIATIAICTGIVIAMVVVMRKILRAMNEGDNDIFDKFMGLSFPAVVSAIAGIIGAVYIVDLAGWIASPTAMAIEQIARMIK